MVVDSVPAGIGDGGGEAAAQGAASRDDLLGDRDALVCAVRNLLSNAAKHGPSGRDVCLAVRREGATLPILMLTARGEARDKVAGLRCGADDYLTKPFEADELLDKVWGFDAMPTTRTIDVHVSWLRRRIEPDPSHPRHLVTVRGLGYRFVG